MHLHALVLNRRSNQLPGFSQWFFAHLKWCGLIFTTKKKLFSQYWRWPVAANHPQRDCCATSCRRLWVTSLSSIKCRELLRLPTIPFCGLLFFFFGLHLYCLQFKSAVKLFNIAGICCPLSLYSSLEKYGVSVRATGCQESLSQRPLFVAVRM